MQNTVRFYSELFNTGDPQDYFINPFCFGDDLGRWLKPRLEAIGYTVDGPDQEDWGWYLECKKDGVCYMVNIGVLEDTDSVEWQIILELRVPLLKRLWTGSKIEAPATLRRDLSDILTGEPDIRQIEWLYMDRRGAESERSVDPQ